MYIIRRGHVGWAMRRGTHGFFLFLDEVERVLESYFCLNAYLRLLFISLQQYSNLPRKTYDPINRLVSLNCDPFLFILFIPANLMQENNSFDLYQRFNDIICTHTQSDQDLLSEISRLQKSAFLSERVREEMKGYPYLEKGGEKLEQMSFNIDTLLGEDTDGSGLLIWAQNAIFNEIVSLQQDTSNLEQQIRKQTQIKLKLAKRLEQLSRNPDVILNQQIRREEALILEESDFAKIRVELDEISVKIESISLIDQDIEGKLSAIQRKNSELSARKDQVNKQLHHWRALIKEKDELTQQLQATGMQSHQIAQQQHQADQQRKLSQNVCQMLRERIELQAQIKVEEAEKEEFMRLLISFKQKYIEVEHRNYYLNQQLKLKGADLTRSES